MEEETITITIWRKLKDPGENFIIPRKYFDQCKFDDYTGAVIGRDYIDQYFRDVHGIYVEDWIRRNI